MVALSGFVLLDCASASTLVESSVEALQSPMYVARIEFTQMGHGFELAFATPATSARARATRPALTIVIKLTLNGQRL